MRGHLTPSATAINAIQALKDSVEAGLESLADGATAFGRTLMLSGRRGQQIVKDQTTKRRSESNFRAGKKEQGGLFGFGGR